MILDRLAIPALTLALVGASVTAVYQWGRAMHAEKTLATERAAISQQITDAVTQARSEEQRRAKNLQEALDAEVIARQAIESDARGAADAASRLRNRAAQLAASCTASNSSPTASSPPASSPADLLAYMLGGAAAAAGEIGSYADRARVAGQTCERAYDALTR